MIVDDPQPAALDASVVLQSLVAGKPPGSLSRFFFGRTSELELLERDRATIAAGHCAMRFIVGEPGAGKSALLNEYLERARRERFVTMRADLSRDCLLYGRTGEGRALLEQATFSMRTLGSAERCAMDAIIGAFRDRCEQAAREDGRSIEATQQQQMAAMQFMPRGNDFASVIEFYSQALTLGDPLFLLKVRRWLLGQYESSADSRAALGVRALDDADFWSVLKLWAVFVRLAGRPGLILVLDEARTLSELQNGTSRASNFARLFGMFNEMAQGHASGIGLFVATTPNLMSGTFNGLCSEPGLGSCLNGGQSVGLSTDLVEGIAIRIADLAPDDLESMLKALRDLISGLHPEVRSVADADIPLFLERSRDRLGGQDYPLPRDIIRSYIKLHNQLSSNPALEWSDILAQPPGGERSVATAAVESGDFAERSM